MLLQLIYKFINFRNFKIKNKLKYDTKLKYE